MAERTYATDNTPRGSRIDLSDLVFLSIPVNAQTMQYPFDSSDRNSHCEASARLRWAIVSGTYSGAGGVGDYTQQVATALAAAGDEVTVCVPIDQNGRSDDHRVRLAGIRRRFGVISLHDLDRVLTSMRPDRVLIQYVPQAFGWQAMNLPFCLWLFARRRRYHIWVMFHEVASAVARGKTVRQNVFAFVTTLMASLAARSATQIFVSIPAWEQTLRPMVSGPQSITWLPVPSNIAVLGTPRDRSRIRTSYVSDSESLIGHFGTYGPVHAESLMRLFPLILKGAPNARVLLTGNNNETFQKRFAAKHPDLAGRVCATGPLPDADLSCHLGACDVMVQPYPDGISTRRTSVMTCLSHALPVVTTIGHLTESLWKERRAVLLSPVDSPQYLADQANWLLNNADERSRLSASGKALYDEQFALPHTIAKLRPSLET